MPCELYRGLPPVSARSCPSPPSAPRPASSPRSSSRPASGSRWLDARLGGAGDHEQRDRDPRPHRGLRRVRHRRPRPRRPGHRVVHHRAGSSSARPCRPSASSAPETAMFIFYYAVLSEVSPPTALAAVAASAITGGDAIKTMWQALEVHPPGLPRAARVRHHRQRLAPAHAGRRRSSIIWTTRRRRCSPSAPSRSSPAAGSSVRPASRCARSASRPPACCSTCSLLDRRRPRLPRRRRRPRLGHPSARPAYPTCSRTTTTLEETA